MNDVVNRILNAYQLKRPLDAEQVADSRQELRDILKTSRLPGSEMPGSLRYTAWRI
jgi:hypothetical protein